jgi:hypothetical protein
MGNARVDPWDLGEDRRRPSWVNDHATGGLAGVVAAACLRVGIHVNTGSLDGESA